MITVILIDKTKIKYNTFDEIAEDCKHQIIKLYCSSNKLAELLNKVNKLFC